MIRLWAASAAIGGAARSMYDLALVAIFKHLEQKGVRTCSSTLGNNGIAGAGVARTYFAHPFWEDWKLESGTRPLFPPFKVGCIDVDCLTEVAAWIATQKAGGGRVRPVWSQMVDFSWGRRWNCLEVVSQVRPVSPLLIRVE